MWHHTAIIMYLYQDCNYITKMMIMAPSSAKFCNNFTANNTSARTRRLRKSKLKIKGHYNDNWKIYRERNFSDLKPKYFIFLFDYYFQCYCMTWSLSFSFSISKNFDVATLRSIISPLPIAYLLEEREKQTGREMLKRKQEKIANILISQ